jgi:hypothetical protein
VYERTRRNECGLCASTLLDRNLLRRQPRADDHPDIIVGKRGFFRDSTPRAATLLPMLLHRKAVRFAAAQTAFRTTDTVLPVSVNPLTTARDWIYTDWPDGLRLCNAKPLKRCISPGFPGSRRASLGGACAGQKKAVRC